MVVSLNGRIGEKPALARGAGQRVLVVADEPELAELLSTTLDLAGYRTSLARSASETLAHVERRRYDLVVADAEMRDLVQLNGRLALVHRPPTLVLTVNERLPGVGRGEWGYVTKPFRMAEVLARMHVLLRGSDGGPRRAPELGYCDLTVDDARCRVRRGTRRLDLTPAEYRLLRHLLANAHQVLSKEQISQYVWGDFRGDNAIEQLVSRLRRKVDQEAPALIHTRRGFGYWLGRTDLDM